MYKAHRGYRDSVRRSHDAVAAVCYVQKRIILTTYFTVLFGEARNEIELECERESSDGMLSHTYHPGGKLFSVIFSQRSSMRELELRRHKRIYTRCYFRAEQHEARIFSSKREECLITHVAIREGPLRYKSHILHMK